MTNLMIINRLSVSLNILAGLEVEYETQDLARRIIEIERRASAMYPRASLFMAFKVVAAKAALDTKDEWQQAISSSIEHQVNGNLVISRQVFEHWVSLKGRKLQSLGTATPST